MPSVHPLTRPPPMLTLTINGEPRSLPSPCTVADLLPALNQADRRGLPLEVNRAVVPAAEHALRQLRPGDEVEIVTFVGGGWGVPADKPLVVGTFSFTSRLITGTGKFATYE